MIECRPTNPWEKERALIPNGDIDLSRLWASPPADIFGAIDLDPVVSPGDGEPKNGQVAKVILKETGVVRGKEGGIIVVDGGTGRAAHPGVIAPAGTRRCLGSDVVQAEALGI